MPALKKIFYIVSDINKALAFEWIAKEINKNKTELHFILIVQKPSELEKWLQENGITCSSFFYRNKRSLLLILYRVYQILLTEKPEIIHCHLLYGSLIGLTAAKLAGIQNRYYTRHHSDYHHRYFPKGIKWDKWCNRIATKIVAPSQAVREVLIKYEQVPDKKICVIHHGFDLKYFTDVAERRVEALRTKFNVGSHTPVVGVIARFTELKGIQYIIPAFQNLLKLYPDALLLLFNAHGDYENEIKSQLKKLLPAENYHLIPFETDLGAAYRLMDVFIQVSIDRTIEAFGQTYIEALASGIPSIFTLSGIASDFIEDKKNALVVPYKNSDAIFDRLLEILTNQEGALLMAAQGRRDVEHNFSLKKMVHSLERLYDC